ncbi:LysR substrate-binding domain-containing protein [Plastoroseomonas hellenica]|uniref:LysR substrate-binding domain-containing protein n=1 Tax=Plastoroseomonas hellenica TaxID=2687306 RepID=UPI001BA629B6|nr:LysR substrate-binding domain-containing protein [Plastoroseomonas hellenica]MBR0641311.1 LysR family transcriptional regulator [Plastoroseomonas hellenica]
MALHLDLVTARLFVAVIEEASIARAAERENIAASAISKRIGELEQRTGLALLRRHRRGVEATPAGAILLRRARGLMQEAALLEEELQSLVAGEQGHIRLCANEASLTGFLPAMLRGFSEAHSNVRIDLSEMLSEDVVRAVTENAADIGIFADTAPAGDLWVQPCYRDSLTAVVARGHPLARAAELRITELLDHEIIGQVRRSSVGSILARAASALGRAPMIRLRVDGFDAVCRLAQEGLGVGIVTTQYAAMMAGGLGLTALPIREGWAKRTHRLCLRDPDRLAAAPLRLAAHLLGIAPSAIASRENAVAKRQAPARAPRVSAASARRGAWNNDGNGNTERGRDVR